MRTPTIAVGLSMFLLLAGGAPALAADNDGDGLRNGFEVNWTKTDPNKRDSDGDGVVDSVEDPDGDRLGNLGEQRFATDPLKADTDGDGTRDGAEDKDGNGRSNAAEQDKRRLPGDLRPSLYTAKTDHPLGGTHGCAQPPTATRAKRCYFGDPASDTRIVLMGDSHAVSWLEAVKRSADQEGWRLITLLRGTCPPVYGIRPKLMHEQDGGRSCHTWRTNAFAWLNAHPPDLIVITHSDSYVLVDSRGRTIPKWKRPAVWKKAMRGTFDKLPAASDVLLLGDVPKNGQNPVECLKSHRWNISACQSRRQPLAARKVEAALREAALEAGEEHRTLYGQVCTYDPCPLVHDNVLLWRDKGHISGTIARRLTPSMRSLLADVVGAVAALPRP